MGGEGNRTCPGSAAPHSAWEAAHPGQRAGWRLVRDQYVWPSWATAARNVLNVLMCPTADWHDAFLHAVRDAHAKAPT
jgi:hypothetical protein